MRSQKIKNSAVSVVNLIYAHYYVYEQGKLLLGRLKEIYMKKSSSRVETKSACAIHWSLHREQTDATSVS